MLEISKKFGLCLGLAASFCMAACGSDSGSDGDSGNEGTVCGDETCKESEVCNSENKCITPECKENSECEGDNKECKDYKCVDKSGEVTEPECTSNDDCKDEAKPVCSADKKCVADDSGNQDGDSCTGSTIKCGESCVEYQTDINNCGKCDNKCDASKQECKDGSCVDKVDESAECQDGMEPTCDEENNVVTCAGGKFSKSSCGSDVCKDGKCEPKEATECDPSEGKSCDGNKVKSCNAEGKYEYKDCGNKACDENTLDCSEEAFEAECKDTDPASCTDANEAKTCSNGKWNLQACGNFLCKGGECTEETVQAECSSDDKPACTEDGKLKSCVDGKFKTEECPVDPVETVCKADDENGASCAPKAAQCPDDFEGDKTADTDGDGVLDCLDACPEKAYKSVDDGCSCDKIKITFGSKEFCATPIETAKDFITIRDDIMSGKRSNTQNDAYALVNDIDFGYGDNKVFRTSKAEWNSVSEFKGVLVSVGDKTINYTTDGTKLGTLECAGDNGCGLFNRLNSARIGDIKLNFNVKAKDGVQYAGALAGYATTSTLKNISVTGNVDGSAERIGGVLGYLNRSTATEISHTGNVTNTTFSYTGGIFGIAYSSTVSSLKSKGDIKAKRGHIGGIFGRVESCSITDLTGDCNIIDEEDINQETGYNNHNSVAGVIAGSSANTSVKNATCNGSVKGNRQIGGCFGTHSGNMSDVTNNAKVTIYNNTADWAAYSGGVIGNAGGGYTYENITNNGAVTCDVPLAWNDRCRRTGGVFGVIGSSRLGTTVKNVVNKGNVTIVKGGGYVGGIIGDSYGVNLENVINEGDINCINSCGGIAGYYTPYAYYAHSKTDQSNPLLWKYTYVDWFVPDIYVKNVVNKGVVNSTSSSVGGIFGLARYHGSDVKWEGLYNIGEVTGTSYVGGLVGQMDWGDHVTGEDKKITLNLTINKSYNSAEINGSDQVGGLIGRLDTRHKNGFFPATDNYFKARCQYSSGENAGSWTSTEWWQWEFNDVDATVKIANSYATGLVSGSSSVGALIGYMYGNNEKVWGQVTDYTYSSDGACTRSSNVRNVKEFTRTGKLVVENSYASAQVDVIGSNSSVGGLIGYIWYKDTASTGVKHSFNNVYTTSPLSMSAGKVIGGFNDNNATPALLEIKNTYYWDKSGANKIVGSGANVTGVTPFDYKEKVPYSGDDSLLNLLLDNSVKIKDAEEWKDKDIKVGTNDKTIPSFDFGPVDWQKNNNDEEDR